MEGTVKKMPDGKNFAFVTGKDGHDYFLHASEFRGNWTELLSDFLSGDMPKVIFEAVENPSAGKGKMRANNCHRGE